MLRVGRENGAAESDSVEHMNVFGTPPPSYFRNHRRELESFRNDYVRWVNRVAPGVLAGGAPDRSDERTSLRHRSIKAQHAVDASGITSFLGPPPVHGDKPTLTQFQQIAFAWENPVYQSLYAGQQAFDLAIDTMDAAIAELESREAQARERRRQPTYWIDRGLRAVLGFPAYLLSLALGFDRRDVSEVKGRALWIVSVIADLGGVYLLGQAFGWW